MKHTAGPWTVGNPEGRLHYIMVGGHTVIATLPDYKGSSSAYVISDREEREANARLIAAAPDLLSALEDAEPFVEYVANIGRNEDAHRVHLALRAAIEKAKGNGPKTL